MPMVVGPRASPPTRHAFDDRSAPLGSSIGYQPDTEAVVPSSRKLRHPSCTVTEHRASRPPWRQRGHQMPACFDARGRRHDDDPLSHGQGL
jgi:hypothetical protein